MALLGLLLASAAFPAVVHGERVFVGRVLRVLDGDTVEVDWDGKKQEVRLEGIDCPERGQPYGDVAKAETARLTLRQFAQVDVRDIDKLGRLVARVRVAGSDASLALVKAGLAWHFKRYSSDPTLAASEEDARKARRGLWVDMSPVPPWEWRHGSRGRSALSPLYAGPGVVHGNTRSRVFHTATCPYFDCKNCKAVFSSSKEAEQAGFRPAGCCHRSSE